MGLIEAAIELAAKAHRDQVRKGTDIPYVTHPYAVGPHARPGRLPR